MPIKQPQRISTFDNLGNGNKSSGDGLRVSALFPIDDKGTIEFFETGIFLLNPSSWQESKSANWVEHNIPGNSDPVLQWTSSGARTVSFEALITADTSDFVSGVRAKPGTETDPLKKATSFVAGIAAAFFKVTAPTQVVDTGAEDATDLDISNYLNYYRSLLYPTYDKTDNPRKLRRSPPLLVLFNGNAIDKLKLGSGPGARVSSQHDLWVLSDLQINITKQLPNLSPMEAVVSFKLIQYNIRSFDRYRFTR